MKLLIILCAVFIFGCSVSSISTSTPSSREDLCDIFRSATENRDPCEMVKLDKQFPGVWTNASACDGGGASFLHVAAQRGDAHSAKTLLALGAALEARDAQGRSPLFHALRRADPVLVAVLLYAGAEVNVADGSGDTPLHAAVAAYVRAEQAQLHSDCRAVQRHVDKLLLAGADTAAENAAGLSPVALAAAANSNITHLLLGNVNISMWDHIFDVCFAWRRPSWEYPQKYSEKIEKRYSNDLDWCGRKPLMYDWTLSDDMDQKDIYSQTVLHRAATGVFALWIKYEKIVDATEDKNIQDWLGQTPLHVAVMCESRPVARFLREGGADVTIKDNLRRIPEDIYTSSIFRPLSTLHKYQ